MTAQRATGGKVTDAKAMGGKLRTRRAWPWVAVLLAAGLACAGPAAALQMDVYEGVMGAGGVGVGGVGRAGKAVGNHVVMELGAPDAQGVRQGRYFYRRHGVDIPLRGLAGALAEAVSLRDVEPDDTAQANLQGAVFADPATGQPRAVWQGRMDGDHYRGEWRDIRTGRSLPFDLTRLARYNAQPGAAPPLALSRDSAPYDFLRVNTPMAEGKEVVLGSVAYRMVADARTRFAYPRLTRHPSAAMLLKTNQILEQRHWAMNLDALACASTLYTDRGPAAGSLASYDQEKIVVEYLSPSLMSVVESGSTFCGGAHPNNHFEPYTLDLLRGGYLNFSRIVKGVKKGEYVPEYSDALVKFIQRAVQRKAKATKPSAKNTDNDEIGCADGWPQYLYLHFKAPNLLAFDISGVGHAMGVCLGTHLTLPFAALQPVLAPSAIRYLGAAR